MAECIECGEYTKFNGGFCAKCYAKKNRKVVNIELTTEIDLDNLDEESSGHSHKE